MWQWMGLHTLDRGRTLAHRLDRGSLPLSNHKLDMVVVEVDIEVAMTYPFIKRTPAGSSTEVIVSANNHIPIGFVGG